MLLPSRGKNSSFKNKPTWPLAESGRSRHNTTTHPRCGWASGTPQSSHDRARAERVPGIPACCMHQCKNDEHHGILSFHADDETDRWYSSMRGFDWPAAKFFTPASRIATSSHAMVFMGKGCYAISQERTQREQSGPSACQEWHANLCGLGVR